MQESTFDPILLLFPSLSKQEGKEFIKQNMRGWKDSRIFGEDCFIIRGCVLTLIIINKQELTLRQLRLHHMCV